MANYEGVKLEDLEGKAKSKAVWDYNGMKGSILMAEANLSRVILHPMATPESKEWARNILKLIDELQTSMEERLDQRPQCNLCRRHVKSPCNSAQGYFENGPWDFACEGYVYPERIAQ